MNCALRIGIFFDGTGNSMGGSDESNVAKLYREYRGDEKRKKDGEVKIEIRHREYLVYKRYITGVGTTEGFVDRKIAKGYGGGVGRKIYDAVKYAIAILDNHPHTTKADGYKIREIDVFGFSRGAAEARGFVNVFYEEIINYDTEKYGDVHFNFIGLFDTVAAIGEADNSINMIPKKEHAHVTWIDDINSGLNPMDTKVGANEGDGLGDEHQNDPRYQPLNMNLALGSALRIVHMTAHDEHRKNFPLVDSYGSGAVEYELIGVHSDVGGGYEGFEDEHFRLPQPYGSKVQALKAAQEEASKRNSQMGAYGASGYGAYTPGVDKKGLFSQFPTPHTEKRYFSSLHKHTPNSLSIVSLHLMYEEGTRAHVPLKKPKQKIPQYLQGYYGYAKVAKKQAWTYEVNRDGHDMKRALSHHSAVDPKGERDNYYGRQGLGDMLHRDSPDGIGGNDANYQGRAIYPNNSNHAAIPK